MGDNPVDDQHHMGSTSWPLLDVVSSYEFAPTPSTTSSAVSSNHTAQVALQTVIQNDTHDRRETSKRRPSRLRLFTNGFPRLRRTGTGDTQCSMGEASNAVCPASGAPNTAFDTREEGEDAKDPSDEAVEAYLRKHARKYVVVGGSPNDLCLRLCQDIYAKQKTLTYYSGTKLGSMIERIAASHPTPADYDDDIHGVQPSSTLPTTLRAAMRMFTEVKVLSEDVHEFHVAVEIEGVLHNRKLLPDTTIDVIFIVDNASVFSK